MHASKPNEPLHFDFFYMGKGERGKVYTLIVKDDLYGYLWLRGAVADDSETTAKVPLNWFRHLVWLVHGFPTNEATLKGL